MRTSRALPVLLLLLLASACGSGDDAVSSEPSVAAPADAADLVGLWTVTGPGVGEGTALALGDSLTLFRACGVTDGSWAADGRQRLLVATSDSGDTSCFQPTAVHAEWLESARGFRVIGAERQLVDAAGDVLATLAPGATPTVGPNRTPDQAKAPALSPERRAALAEPAPLPEGATAPTAAEVAGRWVPTTVAPTREPYVSFDVASATWRGSDGCNGSGGKVALGADGRWLATSGASTLVGCDNSPVTAWVPAAARVGLVSGRLVFYDRSGAVLGEVERPSASRTPAPPVEPSS